MKFIKKYTDSLLAVLILLGILIPIFGFPFIYQVGDVQSATNSIVNATVTEPAMSWGSLKAVHHKFNMLPTPDSGATTFNTGFSYVEGIMPSIGEGATSPTIKAVANSNNGIAGSKNGWIWLTYDGGCCVATASTITTGR